MKAIAIISLTFGLLALASALYCQLELIPAMEGIDRITLTGKMDLESTAYKSYRALWMQKSELKDSLALIAVIGSGLGLLGGIFSGVKKVKLGWLSAAVSSLALGVILIFGTHMLS